MTREHHHHHHYHMPREKEMQHGPGREARNSWLGGVLSGIRMVMKRPLGQPRQL